jgi:2Fe-2S ferredoxin
LPRIHFIQHDGTQREIDAEDGLSVMEAAVRNSVPGIDGDCGGACACATCHVHVDEAWRARLAPRSETETDMLELAEGVDERSRLACQITVSDALDGIVVHLPESQH